MELEALQEIHSEVRALGAQIVVLTPELERYTRALHKKLNLTFEILTDLHLKTAEQFGLVFTLPDYLRELYKSFGSIDTGVHCLRLILGGVFDRFPELQIIVGHNLEILSWSVWRMDYSFPLGRNGGLKRTIKEYLRENFYGGILAGEYVGQDPGAMDSGWSLAYQAYLGMANTVGIDRVVFTTDYPYGDMKAARRFFDQMPISPIDKEKIGHLNAKRLLGLEMNKLAEVKAVA